MFQFKRRTLWIIIYVTIPLIFILNQLGPTEEGAEPGLFSSTPQTQWSLDDISAQCNEAYEQCTIALDNSDEVFVSAVVDRLPISAVDVPASVEPSTYEQGGKFVVTVRAANRRRAQRELLAFLRDWIPSDAQRDWVVTGDISIDEARDWRLNANEGEGKSVISTRPIGPALTVINTPSVGHPDQLAYLIWMEILKQRLAGYSVQMTWDHRQQQSRVLINQTVVNEADAPVTPAELEPVLAAYLDSANQRLRSQEQIHRYLTTAVVYQIPFEYFIEQPERLQAITLEAVNEMREDTLAQIAQR